MIAKMSILKMINSVCASVWSGTGNNNPIQWLSAKILGSAGVGEGDVPTVPPQFLHLWLDMSMRYGNLFTFQFSLALRSRILRLKIQNCHIKTKQFQ